MGSLRPLSATAIQAAWSSSSSPPSPSLHQPEGFPSLPTLPACLMPRVGYSELLSKRTVNSNRTIHADASSILGSSPAHPNSTFAGCTHARAHARNGAFLFVLLLLLLFLGVGHLFLLHSATQNPPSAHAQRLETETNLSLDFSTYSSIGKPMNSECFLTKSLRRRSSRNSDWSSLR